MDRAFGVVLMCLRITKVERGGIAMPVGDKPIVPTSRFVHAAVVALNNLVQILRIYSSRSSSHQ